MILSHKYKFIYLKTIKTASTSIENALCAICGPDDIVTPAAPRFMKLRPNQLAQNYRLDHPAVPSRPLIKRLLGRPERYHHPSVGYYEHMPACRVKTYIGDDIWNSYYKFTFERNPWDRQISFYHFRCRDRNKNLTLEQFLQKRSSAFVENWGIYSINDSVGVDFLGKYENLEDDFAKVVSHLGLPGNLSLPKVNTSSNPSEEGAYRSFYTDKTRDLVGRWYEKEIKYLNYTF
jgi:hypothetical protein